MKSQNIAFALGGLAGNNAHGAGFLAAALEKDIMPLIVSCSSGQILWVYRYLCCLRDKSNCLRKTLEQDISRMQVFPNADLNYARLCLLGAPGVFEPAYQQYLSDLWRNSFGSVFHTLSDGDRTFLFRRFLEIFPCRTLVPELPRTLLEEMADEFNRGGQPVGVVFNSYDPVRGCEYVYLNNTARKLLNLHSGENRFDAGQTSSYRDRTMYQEISPEGVLAGLWLYAYGFDGEYDGHLDGAYFRDIILSELACAELIYVVRPMHFHWSGRLPQDWQEMDALKTKVGFNGAYAGERDQIRLMNKLLSGKLK